MSYNISAQLSSVMICMSPENDGITREIGFKVQKRKVCPYPVFSGGGNGGLVLYYAKG